jgi:hypothetical protein
MTTANITKLALKELDLRGVEAWRQNNLPVRGRTFVGRKGVPDLIGFVRATGVFCLCEVKNIGDTMSESQIALFNEAYAAGCITLIATLDERGNFLLTQYQPD